MFSFLRKKKEEVVAVENNLLTVPEVEETPIPKKSITKNRVLKRNDTQGSQVLSILEANTEGLTRYEIKDLYIQQFGDILDTSLSRAISCLSYDTRIKMTNVAKLERYGKVCHIYKIN
jgi:hypothetical protein